MGSMHGEVRIQIVVGKVKINRQIHQVRFESQTMGVMVPVYSGFFKDSDRTYKQPRLIGSVTNDG